MGLSSLADMAIPVLLIALGLIATGGVVIIVQLARLFFGRKKGSAVLRVIWSLLGCCIMVFGLFLGTLVLFVRTYEAFTYEEPVARVDCVSVDGLDYDMVLRFAPLEGGREKTASLFRLKGDQWSVGGHILQWHPWLHLVGLHTGYRLTRIEGRCVKAEDQVSRDATVYDLDHSWEERIWHWLYRHPDDIPWIKAVYGNSAYTFPAKGKTFLVAVSRSGFMVKPSP